MRAITNLMINDFKLKKLGYDFMGFSFKRKEQHDPEIFYLITSELIDENIKRQLTLDSLRRIRTLLEYFEKEHCSIRNKKGDLLIKESYVRDRIRL